MGSPNLGPPEGVPNWDVDVVRTTSPQKPSGLLWARSEDYVLTCPLFEGPSGALKKRAKEQWNCPLKGQFHCDVAKPEGLCSLPQKEAKPLFEAVEGTPSGGP